MIDLTAFIILGLATWRVSSLLVNERGPLDIFVKIRKLAGIEHDDEFVPYKFPDNFLAQLLSCVWCTSIWVGIFFTTAYLLDRDISMIVALPFSLSSVAVFVDNAS